MVSFQRNTNMSKWIYSKSIPKKIYVACSGGIDSVATAALLSEWRDVTLVHFSHNDHAADYELSVVSKLADQLNVKLINMYQTIEQRAGNNEAQWRDARYKWFHSLDMPVATGHTLDDAAEWYLMTCLRGRGEYMPHCNRNVFRPMLLTDKQSLMTYAVSKNLKWWEDPSNHDPEFSLRSRVRSTLLPMALECEPGLKNMVRRRLVEKIKEDRVKV